MWIFFFLDAEKYRDASVFREMKLNHFISGDTKLLLDLIFAIRL